ncbi:hypothetical protein V1517DRAFT_325840 [Lipomyces orientalis]|uniref:Uncharacterized protein n=1 Tax=Lipomyces orientalis TaxID=1233043 RepID=A0ACC3TLY3_9ASCO
MVDGRDLVTDASVDLRSNAGASNTNVGDSHERVEAAGSAPNPEEIDDDAFAIYSYYISVTDHLPSDIRRSLNLMTSLAQKYTGAANDYELLADVLNNDQYSTAIPILSRLKDVDTRTILRDRRESVREAVRMLQVIRRHYKKLDAEITKLEKAAQVPITSKILQAKASKVKVGVSAVSSVSKPAGADRSANRHRQAVYLKKLRRSNRPISEVQAGHKHAPSLKPIRKPQEQVIRPGSRRHDSVTGSKRIERLEAENTLLSAPRLTRHSQRSQPPPAISTRERLRESQPSQSALKESSSNIRQLRQHGPEKPTNEYSRNLRNERHDRHLKYNGTEPLVEEPRRPLRASTEKARNVIAESPKAVTTSPLKWSLKSVPEIISSETRSLRHRDTPLSQKTTVAQTSKQSLRTNSDLSKQQVSRSSQKPSVPEKRKDIRRAIIDELQKRKDEKEQHSMKRKGQKEAIQDEKPKKRKINEKTYCICDDVSYGNMIACDNKNCKIEWYHLGCVNMKRPPKGTWICPLCAERQKNRRSRGSAR